MSSRIAINGFGRIGRLAFRAAWNQPEVEIVHLNETGGDAACAAHLLYFDSVHGRWDRDCRAEAGDVVVDEKRISYSSWKNPAEVPWGDLGIDIVLDATGKHRTPETLAPYFAAGVKKVIVAAPVKEQAVNIVMGVNEQEYDPARHHILTAASCTTNCLAPVVKVIHEGLGIRHGMITTIHDMTNTQSILDTPHKDLRRARASGLSLIPTSTGSATAIGMIFPGLLGRLDGVAVRVPLLNASLTDCTFEVERPTTVAEVNALLQAAAEGPLRGILGYETRPLVSVDYLNDPRSSIVDALSTMVTAGTQVKILAWYDNEWGYANRYAELARKVARTLPS
ncbi:MAG: ArsJ-associated glyceraldehyde-3-phosphate dehydrogenase [Verrucomicrobiota bacterium]